MLRFTKILAGLLFASLLLSCEEELPPRVLEDFLEAVFDPQDRLDVWIIATEGNDTIMLREGFIVGLRNHSDEILESKARVRGTIELWSLDDSTFRRTIMFERTFFDSITILPESLFTVTVVWDQRDDSCRFAYRTLEGFERFIRGKEIWFRGRGTFRFRARGSVQFFPNVESKVLPEVEFTRIYEFNFQPSEEFLRRVKCGGF
ncbi:MAG: hypothetical protein ACE5H0_11680 [Bacteroidota bacterium]